jgi:hypothetical protein
MLRMMIVRFQRDASGRVTGYVYDNPLVKGIQFTRLGDRPSASVAGSAPAATNETITNPTAAATSAPKLEGLVGEYEVAPGRTLTITLENGQLHGQPTNNPKRPLTHVSGTTFSVGGVNSPITVTFAVGADGRAATILMKQNGQERMLTRVK